MIDALSFPGLSSAESRPFLNHTEDGPDRHSDFMDALGIAQRRLGGEQTSAEADAKDAAERFVAQVLVQPLLKQLRDTDNAAPPFQPTEAEKTFRGIADAQIALDVVRGSNFPLVDSVARGLLSQNRTEVAE